MRVVSLGLGVAFGLLSAGTVFAADLMVSAPPVAVVSDSDWHPYVKAYGGVTVPNTFGFNSDDFNFDAGWLLGGAIGVQVVEGISVELDATYSAAEFSDYPGFGINGATVMGNVVLTGALTDQIAVYGGLGVGAVGVQYTTDSDDSDWGYGTGGQVFVGVSYEVADNVSIFGEARYQAAFDTISFDHEDHVDTADYSRASLLAGVKLGF